MANNSLTPSGVRVRFAPSPTGHLHIGGLRSALFNWLFARHYQGKFFLRIEDTDTARSKQEFTDSILASFAWAQLDYEQPVVIQSTRSNQHLQVARMLIEQGKAYPCFCASKEYGEHDESYSKYTGHCRSLKPHEYDLSKPHAIRFKIPQNQGPIIFDDLVYGRIIFEPEQLDDFIIIRSDGTGMYNFVVVVDDAFMNITHVIRGEDHISNTPKQILLYHACGYKLPQFAHLPMILGADGQRLSKRHAATSVLEYRRAGYLPEALCNYLVRLGWAHGDQEIFTRQELITFFSLDHVGKKGSIFDPQKLDWVNSVYMRNASPDYLLQIMHDDVGVDPKIVFFDWNNEQCFGLVNLYKERVKTVSELAVILQALHHDPTHYDEQAFSSWITREAINYIKELITILESIHEFNHEILGQQLKELCSQFGIKLVALAQPIRIALTGTSASPGVFELMELLGRETTIRRLNALVHRAGQLHKA